MTLLVYAQVRYESIIALFLVMGFLVLRGYVTIEMLTARCAYFAAGDLVNAIKYQSEAVRKEPHSGQMQRQLARFKREAEKRQQVQRQ